MKEITYAIWKHQKESAYTIPDELWDEFASEEDAYRHLQSLVPYSDTHSQESFVGEGYSEKDCSYYLIDSDSCYNADDKDCHNPDAEEEYFEIINPLAEDVGERHPVYILPFFSSYCKKQTLILAL